jgi:hypothetical protein
MSSRVFGVARSRARRRTVVLGSVASARTQVNPVLSQRAPEEVYQAPFQAAIGD